MSRAFRTFRPLPAVAAVLTLGTSFAVSTARADPIVPLASSLLVASGPFAADAEASLLTIDMPALSPSVLPKTNVDVGRSQAATDSDGDLDGGDSGTQRTAARAATTGDSALLGTDFALQENSASAPASETNEQTLASVPLDPLLNIDVIDTLATANWASDTECGASSEPLSLARQEFTDATVVVPEDGQSLVDVTAGEDGAVDVEASTGLPATGGSNDQRAVSASVSATLGSVDALNSFVPGIASAVAVSVVRAPNYTASATGFPGGAEVLGDDPIVNVAIGGGNVFTLEAGAVEEETLVGLTLGDLLDGLNPLLEPLQPVVRVSVPVTKYASADGTSAGVTAALLRVEILPPAAVGASEPLGSFDLAPMSARVFAPTGGITCGAPINNPVELQKVNSGPAVPGSSFDYTIAVGNVGDCTLTNVRVSDVMGGPAGTTIVSTRPAGATVTPAAAPALYNIAFPDVGPIAPDGRVTLTIRAQVPANAPTGARYNNRVTVAADCDGSSVTREFMLAEPEVEPRRTGDCAINGSTKSTSHLEVYRGEQFAYFVNLFNHGGVPCTGATITDALDPRVRFVSCVGCTPNGQVLSFDVGTLAPGQSITFPIIVQVDPAATGALPNTARADANETAPVDLRAPGPNITGRSIPAGNNPAVTPSEPR